MGNNLVLKESKEITFGGSYFFPLFLKAEKQLPVLLKNTYFFTESFSKNLHSLSKCFFFKRKGAFLAFSSLVKQATSDMLTTKLMIIDPSVRKCRVATEI